MVAIPAIEGGLYMVPWMIVGGRLDAMASSTTERAILVLAGSLGRKVPPIGYINLFAKTRVWELTVEVLLKIC